MWQATTERARRDIAALAGRGLGVAEVHRRAIDVVTRAVPADMTCWGVLDPASLLISSMVGGEDSLPEAYGPLLAAAEYDADEPNTFAGLARQHRDVALLSELPWRDRDRSARLRTVWQPLGIDREVRTVFAVDGAVWGAAGMVRAGTDFSARETEFLAAVAPVVARATRDEVRDEVSVRAGTAAVAVVLLDDDGRVRSLTPGAERWREAVEATSPGRFRVLMQMVVSATRSAPGGELHLRVRDGEGGWTTVSGSRLRTGTGGGTGGGKGGAGVVVTAASVGGEELVELLLEAYGLSRRERDVSREVMAGGSTTEIAARLFLSPHTVQDHLKSVFGKVGVRSRGDLVARLRPGLPVRRD